MRLTGHPFAARACARRIAGVALEEELVAHVVHNHILSDCLVVVDDG